MNPQTPTLGKTYEKGFMVPRPQVTDALGHTLRGIFGDSPMPDDLVILLKRLDHVTH